MRVPIYPNDLLPKAAFKKLARSITKRWPGQSPIQQLQAIETLSKGLGYPDYHKVRLASLTCPSEMPTPSETTVRGGIAAEVSSFLKQSNDTSVSRTAVERFVDALPLKALSAFKRAGSQVTPVIGAKHSKLDLTGDHACFVNDACPATEVPAYTSPTPELNPTLARWDKGPRRPTTPPKSTSQSDLDAIKRVIESSGNLRDQSIFELFEMALRGHEIAGLKVLQNPDLHSNTPFSLEINTVKPPLPVPNGGVIERYITSENLTAEDYLFPSKNDRNQPMATARLLEACRSWEASAGLSPGNITPASVREGLLHRSLYGSTDLSNGKIIPHQLGHDTTAMSDHYTVKFDAEGVQLIRKDNDAESEPSAARVSAARKIKDEL